jgi:hypothetical protein
MISSGAALGKHRSTQSFKLPTSVSRRRWATNRRAGLRTCLGDHDSARRTRGSSGIQRSPWLLGLEEAATDLLDGYRHSECEVTVAEKWRGSLRFCNSR